MDPIAGAAYRGIKIRLFEKRDRVRSNDLLKQHHENTLFRNQLFSEWKYNEQTNRVVLNSSLMFYFITVIKRVRIDRMSTFVER